RSGKSHFTTGPGIFSTKAFGGSNHEMISPKGLGGCMTVTTADSCKPPNRRRALRMGVMLAALTLASVACSTSRGTDMPGYQTAGAAATDLTTQSYATTDQVLAAVAAAQQTQALSDAAAEQLAALSQGKTKDGPEHCFD